MTLRRALGFSIAGLMVLVGGVWTGQGLGYLEGSSMTGDRAWAAIGPIVAGLGVALAISIVQRARQRRHLRAQRGDRLDNRYR